MLVLSGGQVETLFDLGLPVEVAELPADLAALDRLLDDAGLLGPIEAAWAAEHRDRGRPSVAMDRFVRLMIVKARSGGWATRRSCARFPTRYICGGSAGSRYRPRP